MKQELLCSLEGDAGQAEISRFAQKIFPVKGREHQGAPEGSLHCGSILLQNTSCHACLHAQLCPILCNPMDNSPPDSSVHGIFQARTRVGCYFLVQGLTCLNIIQLGLNPSNKQILSLSIFVVLFRTSPQGNMLKL